MGWKEVKEGRGRQLCHFLAQPQAPLPLEKE
jgi:hypothetical protein